MNINKEVNKLQKATATRVEELALANIEELDALLREKYEPLLEEMRELVEQLYNCPKIEWQEYNQLMERLLDVSVFLRGRNEFLHNTAESVLIANRESLGVVLNELREQLYFMPITDERLSLELRKAQHNAIKKQTYLLNEYHSQVDNEVVATIEYVYDSFKQYVESDRILHSDIEAEEIKIEFEVEQENVRFVKTDKVKDVIAFVRTCGFKFERQNGTSHSIFKHQKNEQIVVIPNHGSTIDVYLGLAIQKQAYSKSL